MRKNAKEVVEAFQKREAFGGGAIWTDGKAIYSYKMKIAWRKRGGEYAVAAYASSPSRTTTSHIHDCLVGLGVERDKAVKVKKPKIKEVPLGQGERVFGKKAAQAQFHELKNGSNVFRIFPSIPEESPGYGVAEPTKPAHVSSKKPKYTPI